MKHIAEVEMVVEQKPDHPHLRRLRQLHLRPTGHSYHHLALDICMLAQNLSSPKFFMLGRHKNECNKTNNFNIIAAK